ncbi:hypothetical protein [Serinibacter salmoneus]|uniref:hypothetical protein n=1 Tax=Serinibacter salmoneus TaxID=556530 RepID=UPI000BF87C25|nr:hypothetical protein [Serinibacter salmoneus]
MSYPAPVPDGQARTETTWTVPAGVTSVTFAVAGGGGGYSNALGAAGSGALITGEMAVTGGQVLTLITGAGGIGNATQEALGGGGYGNGGDVVNPAGPSGTNFGGSGGGGSAILLAGSPLVVAGGGGGNGSFAQLNTAPSMAWGTSGAVGGTPWHHGGGQLATMENYPNQWLVAPGGLSALAGGAGGAGGQWQPPAL